VKEAAGKAGGNAGLEAEGPNEKPAGWKSSERYRCRGPALTIKVASKGDIMDMTTILIIVVVILLLGGGGLYGRGRWY
jgi:hypothetical protein